MAELNKTQLYRKMHYLCIDCMAPLYASERDRYVRCEACRQKVAEAKFLKLHGYPMPVPEKVETPEPPKPKPKKNSRIITFSERVARCQHCEWASYLGNNVIFCLFPYCVKETVSKKPKPEEVEEAGT